MKRRVLVTVGTHVFKHCQEVKRPEVAGHASHFGSLSRRRFVIWKGIRKELDRRCEADLTPFCQGFFGHNLAVEIDNVPASPNIELQDIKVAADEVRDLRNS